MDRGVCSGLIRNGRYTLFHHCFPKTPRGLFYAAIARQDHRYAVITKLLGELGAPPDGIATGFYCAVYEKSVRSAEVVLRLGQWLLVERSSHRLCCRDCSHTVLMLTVSMVLPSCQACKYIKPSPILLYLYKYGGLNKR